MGHNKFTGNPINRKTHKFKLHFKWDAKRLEYMHQPYNRISLCSDGVADAFGIPSIRGDKHIQPLDEFTVYIYQGTHWDGGTGTTSTPAAMARIIRTDAGLVVTYDSPGSASTIMPLSQGTQDWAADSLKMGMSYVAVIFKIERAKPVRRKQVRISYVLDIEENPHSKYKNSHGSMMELAMHMAKDDQIIERAEHHAYYNGYAVTGVHGHCVTNIPEKEK